MNIKTRKKFTSIKELEEESKRLGIPFDYSKAEKELMENFLELSQKENENIKTENYQSCIIRSYAFSALKRDKTLSEDKDSKQNINELRLKNLRKIIIFSYNYARLNNYNNETPVTLTDTEEKELER